MSTDGQWLHQVPYAVRAEWGPRAAFEASRRGDVVVLVDVLSFSTAVAAGVGFGAAIAPFEWGRGEAADREAQRIGAKLCTDAPGRRRALSPLAFSEADRGGLYLLCSPNGATCSRIARAAPAVFAGCLRNANAVAIAAHDAALEHDAAVTVVACGEVWPETTGDDVPRQRIRMCVEDALGAGAILARLDGSASPESQLLVAAFDAARPVLTQALLDCASGRELSELGYADDVEYAADHNASDCVPVLRNERFVAM